MRRLGLAIAAVLLVATAPANAAWKSFKYPQYGFGVDFPAEPKTSKGEYRGVIAGRMPTTIIGAELDGTIYQVEMVDFSNRLAETPVLLEEAVFLATQDGKLVSDVTARTDNGAKFAKYGRRVTTLTKDGGKKITELYLVNGKLLMFEGIITPKGDIENPEAARFQDSILFNLDRDWTIPPPLPANAADGPRILKPVRPGEKVPN
ncbi:MAG TPA: hypothetical protein VHT51_03875 [Micropepsaceae bacterium]|jgi:hypothetical protein|nr:hypothetical protein [Micropepsaceae bacterium]